MTIAREAPLIHEDCIADSCNHEQRVESKLLDRPRRNLGIVSGTFLFLYTAFFGVQNLASSLDKRQESGAESFLAAHHVSGSVSVGIIYCCFVASCMYGPAVVHGIGAKAAIVCAIVPYFLYVLAYLVPQPFTLYPTAALVGFVAGPLWVAQGSFCTCIAQSHAALLGLPLSASVGMVQGVFFAAQRSTQVIGNLLASFVQKSMSTFALFAMYATCILLGFFLMLAGADNVLTGPTQASQPLMKHMLQSTWKVFLTRKMLLMWPVLLLIGLQQALAWDVLTASFIEPALGESNIGFVMACYGIADAVGSVIFGRLSDVIGRKPVLLIGCFLFALVGLIGILSQQQVSDQGGTTFWPLNSWMTLITYAMAFGLGDGMLQTVMVSAMACPQILSPEETEAGFANVQLWPSVIISCFFFAPSSVGLVRPKMACVSICAIVAAIGVFCSPELAAGDAVIQSRSESSE